MADAPPARSGLSPDPSAGALVGVELVGVELVGVDWGTSSFRAFRLAPDGAVLDRRASARGILQVTEGGFPAALRAEIGDWLGAGRPRILLSGMVGSRQGWREAPYLPCPAGAADLAAALMRLPADGLPDGVAAWLVPGVSGTDGSGVPEVMRGEETQIVGALRAAGTGDADGLVCLPGSHSKWVRVRQRRIAGFATHMTGEAFAALRGHTILGRMMRDAAEGADANAADRTAFADGIARSAEPGGLLHHLFGVRTLGLTGRLGAEDAPAYLSGLLLGHEVRAALAAGDDPDGRVRLIGSAALCALYARAIGLCGGKAEAGNPDAAAYGLAAIGALAAWR